LRERESSQTFAAHQRGIAFLLIVDIDERAETLSRSRLAESTEEELERNEARERERERERERGREYGGGMRTQTHLGRHPS